MTKHQLVRFIKSSCTILKLGRASRCFFLTVCALLLIDQGVLLQTLRQHQFCLEVQRLALRERYLAQQLALHAVSYVDIVKAPPRHELVDEIALLMSAQLDLRNIEVSFRASTPRVFRSSAELSIIPPELDAEFASLEDHATAIANSSAPEDARAHVNALVEQAIGPLLNSLTERIGGLQNENSARIAQLEWLQSAAFELLLFTLLLQAISNPPVSNYLRRIFNRGQPASAAGQCKPVLEN